MRKMHKRKKIAIVSFHFFFLFYSSNHISTFFLVFHSSNAEKKKNDKEQSREEEFQFSSLFHTAPFAYVQGEFHALDDSQCDIFSVSRREGEEGLLFSSRREKIYSQLS